MHQPRQWLQVWLALAGATGAVALLPLGTDDSQARSASAWRPGMEQARAYSARRQGSISFAVIDQRGGYRGHRSRQAVPAASVFKAMLLVAYLRRGDVRGRPLRTGDRRLLAPMIRRSDNATASRIVVGLGPRRIHRLAARAGMRRFRLRRPWGASEITARDQVRFFHRLETYAPKRHRAYARMLHSPSHRLCHGDAARGGAEVAARALRLAVPSRLRCRRRGSNSRPSG